MHNNDFESFVCRKTSMEDIEVSDGRSAQNMSTDWVCSIECVFSVCSHLLVVKYAFYRWLVWTVSFKYHIGISNL